MKEATVSKFIFMIKYSIGVDVSAKDFHACLFALVGVLAAARFFSPLLGVSRMKRMDSSFQC